MLCTRQTLEIATDRVGAKYKDRDGNEVNNVSAVTFLMEQIKNCPEKGDKEITYRAFPLYRNGKDNTLPEIRCEEVLSNTDENIGMPKTKENALKYAMAYEKAYPSDYLSGMRETIQRIRKIDEENKKENSEKTPFYIVTHGGPRDVMLSLNAVISLLDEEKIEPAKICGTNLATKMVEDQKASFDMFRFVSGMRDFLNFGNVDVLQKYYKESAYLYGSDRKEAEAFNEKLLGVMQQISKGVQYSDPEKYIQGLDSLKEILDTDSENKFEKTNLGIFKDTIKEEFGILLDPIKRTEIDLVERCLDKKQYQQALTFLESTLPEYYRKKEIVAFSNDMDYANAFKIFLGQLRFNGDDIKKAAYNYIKTFCTKIENLTSEERETLWKEYIEDRKQWYEGLEMHVKENTLNEVCKKGATKIEIDFTRNDSKEDFVEKVLPILMMHKALKELRHKVNHGDKEWRPSYEDLDMYMRYYLKALRALADMDNLKTDATKDTVSSNTKAYKE